MRSSREREKRASTRDGDRRCDKAENESGPTALSKKLLPMRSRVRVQMEESIANIFTSSETSGSELFDLRVFSRYQGERTMIQTETLPKSAILELLSTFNNDDEKHSKRQSNETGTEFVMQILKHTNKKKERPKAARVTLKKSNVEKARSPETPRTVKSPFEERVKSPPKDHKTTDVKSPIVEASVRKTASHWNTQEKENSEVSQELIEDYGSDDALFDDSDLSDDLTPSFKVEGGDHENAHHVYASPRSMQNINAFKCLNSDKNNKGPCYCDHCTTACLLSECQKRPIAGKPDQTSDSQRKRNRRDTSEYRSPRKRKEAPTEEKLDYASILYHLVKRMDALEARVEAHEENTVSKSYFKRIITKLVSHFSERPSSSKGYHHADDEDSGEELRYRNRYSINTTLIENEGEEFEKFEHEILEQGLLDDDFENDILNEDLLEFEGENKVTQVTIETPVTGDQFQNNDKVEHIKNQSMDDTIEDDLQEQLSPSKFPVKSKLPRLRKNLKKSKQVEKSIEAAASSTASYLNPKLSTWQGETSQISSTSELSAADTNTRTLETKNSDLASVQLASVKEDFLQTLAKSKAPVKKRLWNSIWNQAQLNGQTKEDMVIVQLSKCRNRVKGPNEIELTIAEIENALISFTSADGSEGS